MREEEILDADHKMKDIEEKEYQKEKETRKSSKKTPKGSLNERDEIVSSEGEGEEEMNRPADSDDEANADDDNQKVNQTPNTGARTAI
jgi:hypothetical protein